MKRASFPLFVTLLLGCVQQDVGGGVLVLGVAEPFQSQADVGKNDFGRVVMQFAAERLFVRGPGGRLVPVLAEDIKVDGRRWEVTLGDHTFASGRTVTTEDVAASFRAAGIDGLERIDVTDQKVVFTLDQPDATFALALANVWILPEDQAGSVALTELDGSGQFRVKLVGDHAVLMVPNSDHSTPPKLSGWVVTSVPDSEALWVSLVSNEIDAAPYMEYQKGLESLSHVQRIASSRQVVTLLRFNCRDPRLADPAVRRALNLAISRKSLAKLLSEQHGEPLASFHRLGDPYDPRRATELLREAGWTPSQDGVLEKGGVRLALDALVWESQDDLIDMLQGVRLQLSRVGVAMTVVPVSWEEYEGRQLRGDFALAGLGIRGAIPYLVKFYSRDSGSIQGDVGYCGTPEIVAAADAVNRDPGERSYREYLDVIQRVSATDPAALFLWRETDPLYVHSRFKGVDAGDTLGTALPNLYVPADRQLPRDDVDYWVSELSSSTSD